MQTDIGDERIAAGRLGPVSSLIIAALRAAGQPGTVPQVLDCGGGSGAFAVPLAACGADVTVVDISADALATLRRRAEEAGVSASVREVAGDVEALADLVAPASFDAALVHGILDAVDDPGATLAAIAATVRPGGLISVLVANPIAAVIARALAGEPALALAELRGLDAPAGRVDPTTVQTLCDQAGLIVEGRRGVGVFSDLVPGFALDAPGAREALAHLDAEGGGRAPFADLAGRIHLVVRVPSASSAPSGSDQSGRGT